MSIVSIVLFYLMILGAGIYASRLTAGEAADSYLLADRKLPGWIAIFTMTATWLGGGYICGTAEYAFTPGFGLLWSQGAWGYGVALILGGLFYAKFMRKNEYTTMIDPIEQRFGPKVGAMASIFSAMGDVIWTGAILTALGACFTVLLDLDLTTSIIISAAIAVFYTMLGGLRAVAYTDIAQITFLVFGMIVAVAFVVPTVGGVGASLSAYSESFGVNAGLMPPFREFASLGGLDGFIWLWIDFTLVFCLGGIPWQVYFQRVLASKSPENARTMSIIAGVLCTMVGLAAAYVGIVAASFPFSAEASAVLADNPSKVFPLLLREATPGWVGTLGLAAVAAAVMSTMDSAMLSASTMMNRNLMVLFFPRSHDNQTLPKGVKIGIVVLGTVSTILALQVKSVYALWFLCAEIAFIGLFPLLTAAVYFRNVTPVGAGAGLAAGLFVRTAAGLQDLGIPAMLTILSPAKSGYDGGFIPIRTIAMITALVVQQVVSLIQNQAKTAPLAQQAS